MHLKYMLFLVIRKVNKVIHFSGGQGGTNMKLFVIADEKISAKKALLFQQVSRARPACQSFA